MNPGSQRFLEAVNSEIYVDKTEMILYLNSVVCTKQKYVSVSRPRRFGKSMAADMICAYYGEGDGRDLFSGLKLGGHDGWENYCNHFDVIRLVMTRFFKKDVVVQDALVKMQKNVIRDIKKQYPDVDYLDDTDIIQTMEDVYSESGRQFVIVIDEWDAVFRVCKEDGEGQIQYLDFLRDWLKDQEYIALAYMTGILPIKKYGEHSALNMFDEYSMINPMQLAPYTGFTKEEVEDLCREYNMSYEDISNWYDGYDVRTTIPVAMREKYRMDEYEGKTIPIYSPLSVVKAMSTGLIQNYWNKTENCEALAEYIRMNYDGLKDAVALMMDGAGIQINLSTYQNDMTSFHGKDDVLSLLIHLGYLRYDVDTGEVSIPNKEILDEFKASTKSEEWVDTFKAFKKSQELLNATWNGKEDKVSELLEWFHDNAENKTYNSEAALSYAVQMAYYAAQKYYTTIQELDSGKGYVDLVYLPSPKYPDKSALLIELKYGKTADTAVDQIRRRNYPQKLEHYEGNIILVGVNYDKDLSNDSESYKHHNCTIEKVNCLIKNYKASSADQSSSFVWLCGQYHPAEDCQ